MQNKNALTTPLPITRAAMSAPLAATTGENEKDDRERNPNDGDSTKAGQEQQRPTKTGGVLALTELRTAATRTTNGWQRLRGGWGVVGGRFYGGRCRVQGDGLNHEPQLVAAKLGGGCRWGLDDDCDIVTRISLATCYPVLHGYKAKRDRPRGRSRRVFLMPRGGAWGENRNLPRPCQPTQSVR